MTYKINRDNGIAYRGNCDRMKKLMRRATAGEQLTIGFIGGSITQGSLSTKPNLCYAYHVYEWWQKNFPMARFKYVNAGIGGTTSQFGAARVDSDLLSKKPDFVIIEFSVNDESDEHFLETYEGLVRKVYEAKNEPAVLLVHNVYYHNGGNAQIQHGKIGRHYELPCVSMQSSIYPEVVTGHIPNREITPDDLHPNDAGHELVASVITNYLELMNWDKNAPEEEAPKLIEPLTKNTYEHSVRYQNYNSKPKCIGFTVDNEKQKDITDCFKNGWTASDKGAGICFFIKGSGISVQYRKSVNLPAPVAEIVIDDDREHAVRLDANFDETWGDKLELDTITEHTENKVHKVEIQLVETHEDDAVPFYLVSVIGADAYEEDEQN